MFGVQGVYPLGKVLLESVQRDFFGAITGYGGKSEREEGKTGCTLFRP